MRNEMHFDIMIFAGRIHRLGVKMTMISSNAYKAISTISLSFVVMRAFSYTLRSCVQYPISLRDGPRRKQWLYRNICISLVHSSVSAVMSVYSFYNQPSMLTEMIEAWSWIAFYLTSFSLGYFIHDLLDLVSNDFTNSGSLVLHHVLVIGAFGMGVFKETYMGFAMCSLLVEINSVFLHSRRILSFHNVSKTSLKYQINGILMLITFIAFRFLTIGWMSNFVIQNRHKLPIMVVLYGSIAAILLMIINILLFLVIWNSDFKKRLQIK